MRYLFLFSVLFFVEGHTSTDGPCDVAMPLGSDATEMAQSIDKKCSPIDLQNLRDSGKEYDLSGFLDADQDKLCTCLDGAKFNEIVVPN